MNVAMNIRALYNRVYLDELSNFDLRDKSCSMECGEKMSWTIFAATGNLPSKSKPI